MAPKKLLFDKLRNPKESKANMLGGIGPKRLLLERSRYESCCKFEMLSGIWPLMWFLFKFRMIKPANFVSSRGRSPCKLFLERSMPVKRKSKVVYFRSRPYIHNQDFFVVEDHRQVIRFNCILHLSH